MTTRLDCEAFAALVEGRDPEARPDPVAMREHLEGCPACAAAYPEIRALYALQPEAADGLRPPAVDRPASPDPVRSIPYLRVASLLGLAGALGLLLVLALDEGQSGAPVDGVSNAEARVSRHETGAMTSDARQFPPARSVRQENWEVRAQRFGSRTIQTRTEEGVWQAPLPAILRNRKEKDS